MAQTIAHSIVNTIETALVTPTTGPVTAQSTWSVSTSMALLWGVNIQNIIRAADCASASIFTNHYLTEHRERENEFARAVLGSARC